MALSVILLLIFGLLGFGGWLDDVLRTKADRMRAFLLWLGLLALSAVGTVRLGRVALTPAPVVLFGCFLFTGKPQRKALALLLGVVSGLAGWQLCEWFPLFAPQEALMILPAVLLCYAVTQTPDAKRLMLSLAPIAFAVCVTVQDGILFRYSVVRIGTGEGFAASLLGIFAAREMRKMPELRAKIGDWRGAVGRFHYKQTMKF